MSELEARFRVRLEGMDDFSSKLKRGERDAKEFQKAVAGAFKDSAKEIAGFAASTAKSLASLALGNVGIAAQAKNVLAFRDSVAQLTVTAGLGADKMAELRDEIHKVSKSSNQMQDDVAEALSAFVERTGDIDTARKNLELYGKVATATGASIKDVAYVGVELSQKLGIKDPEQQRKALAILTGQGKMGAVEIRDLATKAPAMFSAAAGMFDVGGIEGLRGTGAMAQVFARAFGGKATAGMTSTAVRQMFTDMTRRKEMIDFTLGKDTRGQDPYETVKQLIVATGGDAQALLKNHGEGIFTPTALAGVRVMAKAWRDKKKQMGSAFDPKTMGFEDFDRFKNVSDDFGMIDKDFAIRRGTGQAALNASHISIAESSDKNLGGAFDWLAHRAHFLSDAFDLATKNIGATAAIFAAAILGKNLGGAMLNMGIRGVGLGITPVHIASASPGVGLGAGAAGSANSFGSRAAAAFGVIAAVGIGYEVGRILDAKFGISTKAAKVAGAITGQNTTDVLEADDKGRYAARDRNKAAYGERNARIRYYEGQGMEHGAAIAAADAIAKAIRDMTVTHNVTINGDSAKGETEGGTRSPEVRVRRGQMQFVGGG